MTNILNPEPNVENPVDDRDHELVESFLEEYSKYSVQTDRLSKLEEIEEDNQILEDLTARLPQGDRPQMKPSMYFKLLRIYDTQASKLPKIRAKREGADIAELSLVDSVKDILFDDAGMDEVWYDCLQGFKAEGSSVVQVGFNDDGDIIPVERCQLAELYFDATRTSIASDSEKKGRNIKTLIREVSVTYADFIDMYPEMEGKVQPGSPGNEERKDVFQATDQALVDKSDRVGIHYAYSIQDRKNPVCVIYAGAGATIVEKQEGKEYAFWKKLSNGKDVPFLPFVDFHFSSVKRGFYSVSMIGMMKDAGEAYRKILNASLPVFSRAVNPIIMLLGSKEQRTLEEMKMASELQDLGLNPTIAVGEDNVAMQTVAPQGVFQEFEAARTAVFRDLAMRYDINFQSLEEVEQTATEFVGKTKTEIKAIAGLYTVNKPAFDRLASYMVALAAEYWKVTDKRILDVVVDEEDGDTIGVEMGQALTALKDWSGSFETEVDLRVPSSTADKATAITELLTELTNFLNTVPFSNEDEAAPFIALLEEKIALRELDQVITRPRLKKMVQSLIARRSGPQEATGIPQQTSVDENSLEAQDIQRELAPQSFLADSGLTP
jgi:hypothetical protein